MALLSHDIPCTLKSVLCLEGAWAEKVKVVWVYANESDWAPFKNLCGHLQELFLALFDLGVILLDSDFSDQHVLELERLWQVFTSSVGISPPDLRDSPAYANSTRAVLRRHSAVVLEKLDKARQRFWALNSYSGFQVVEVSVTLLLNFYIAQLEHNGLYLKSVSFVEQIDPIFTKGRQVGRDLVQEMYGDASSLRVVFHEIPGKRWDALTHLLDLLGVSEQAVRMAEVGVEAANTSQRLLERNPFLSYIGVDPYFKNDGLYADVLQRLSFFIDSGPADESLDIVFLDARHDYEAVLDDVMAWKPKVRAGGILSGHDFSWMFPTVACYPDDTTEP
eukprot:symbB.v1.2.037488.t1/scaffold5553.1/size25922/3